MRPQHGNLIQTVPRDYRNSLSQSRADTLSGNPEAACLQGGAVALPSQGTAEKKAEGKDRFTRGVDISQLLKECLAQPRLQG